MTKFLSRLWAEDVAQDLAEYALLLFMVCMTAVSAVNGLAAKVNSVYSTTSTHMAVATSSASLTGGSSSFSSAGPANTPLKSQDKKKDEQDD
jgi:Flp pilus assembly pilin Flp